VALNRSTHEISNPNIILNAFVAERAAVQKFRHRQALQTSPELAAFGLHPEGQRSDEGALFDGKAIEENCQNG
jgi:hypothetical protein